MSSTDDPRGAIVAAEVAASEGDYDTAPDALHEAKSRIMRQRGDSQ